MNKLYFGIVLFGLLGLVSAQHQLYTVAPGIGGCGGHHHTKIVKTEPLPAGPEPQELHSYVWGLTSRGGGKGMCYISGFEPNGAYKVNTNAPSFPVC